MAKAVADPVRLAGPEAVFTGRSASRPGTNDAFAVGALMVAWSLVVAGIARKGGNYSTVALALVVAGWLLLAVVVATGRLQRLSGTFGIRRLIAVLAVPAVAVIVLQPGGMWEHVGNRTSALASDAAFRAAAVAAVATLVPAVDRRRGAWAIPAVLAAVAGVLAIRAVPDPRIDVWYLLQDSTRGLWHGLDMYRQHWPRSHGLRAVYPYLPVTSVLLAPFRLLFGDVRYGLLAASLLSSFVLRRMSARGVPALLPLLVVLYPGWTYGLRKSWTEPLLIAALTLMVYAVRRGRQGWAIVAFAVALACKQHIVLLVPFAIWWREFGWRRTVQSIALAVVMVLPWVAAGPRDFWHDVVTANLMLPVLAHALCIPAFLLRHGIQLSFVFLGTALAAAYAVSARLTRSATGFLVAGALLLCTLNVANKQSFFNHYTLPLALVVTAVVTLVQPTRTARELAHG